MGQYTQINQGNQNQASKRKRRFVTLKFIIFFLFLKVYLILKYGPVVVEYGREIYAETDPFIKKGRSGCSYD